MALETPKDSNQCKYIFGPVASRRLGLSLGVDMVPFKTCTYNCTYCECGKTTNLTSERREYVPSNELIHEIDQFLAKDLKIDVITFAGSGEPTLNTSLDDVIHHIKSHYPDLKTAILTNGSTLPLQEVRQSLMPVDYTLPSLDAISQLVFEKINNPVKQMVSSEIIEGLTRFSRSYKGTLWVEVFIVPGINDTKNELSLIKDALINIKPGRIQLNSLDRPGAYSWVKPVSKRRMLEIADYFLPLPVEIIARKFSQPEESPINKKNIDTILHTLKRRPMTIEDLAVSFRSSINSTCLALNNLVQKRLVKSETVGNKIFYRTL